MEPGIFPKGFFKEDFKRLYEMLEQYTSKKFGTHAAKDYIDMFRGYEKAIDNTPVDYSKINTLKEELTDVDRRRGCDWKKTFPWLNEFQNDMYIDTIL